MKVTLGKAGKPMNISAFPAGFTGDKKALHEHHQNQLSLARRHLEEAKKEVERWEELEKASSRLALSAMLSEERQVDS